MCFGYISSFCSAEHVSYHNIILQPHIIKRYDDMLDKMNNSLPNKLRGSYIQGWKQLIENYSEDEIKKVQSELLINLSPYKHQ